MNLHVPFNKVLQGLPTYQPGRPIEEVAREIGGAPEDIIKLASNENPLGPSPAAMAAVQRAAGQCHYYPDGQAFYLKRELAEVLEMGSENLILGNGSNELIEWVGHVFLEPGAEVVVSEYCFAIYPIVARLFGAEVVAVPAKQYGHDLAGMLAAVTPRTRVMFVANPNNPTGTLAPRKELVRLLHEVPAQVLLVLDEAYIEYLESPVDCLPLIRAGELPNLLLMRTFSKIFGLAGLRVGYGIGHPELVGLLEKTRQPFNLNALAQAAARAALGDRDHLERSRANNALGRTYLQQAFGQMGLEYVPSAANFVLVRVGDGKAVFEALQKRGIITRPMGGYGLPEWVRVSVGTPEQNTRCVTALREVLGMGAGAPLADVR